MLTSAALRPGDRIRIVAASGPVPEDRFNAGVQILRQRYEVVFDPAQVFAKQGYLAGDDASRAAALNAAFMEPGTKAIWMARGGYGLTRILPALALTALQAHPKIIVGFSDVTALLAACATAGLASVHGPVVTQLTQLCSEDLDHLWQLLEGEGPTLLSDLEAVTPGVATGRLLGGNLEVFSRLIGTPYVPDLHDAVLFFEDVGERPYRIDRLLTHLQQAGVFSRARGLVLGEFFQCQDLASNDSPEVQEVLRERLGGLSVPVAQGGLFGHGKRNRALPYGAQVVLDVGQGVLKIK
ncbi:MAG: LD-carboxypeptidase [Deltaproteobacteria bacterium]|nr:LD-carboxypeptidase [Deltaproteobacteria bacterium]